MKRTIKKPAKVTSNTALIKKAVKQHAERKVEISGYRYLIIDDKYRVFKTKVLSGKLRAQCLLGNISIVNIKTMEGLNTKEYMQVHGEEWSNVQDWE